MGKFARHLRSRVWTAGLTAAAALSVGAPALAQTGPYRLDSSFGVQGTTQATIGNFFYFNYLTGLPRLQALDEQDGSYADPTHGGAVSSVATPALPNPSALPAGTRIQTAQSFGDLGTGTLTTNAGKSFAPDYDSTLPWLLDTGEMKSTTGSAIATGEISDTLQITNPDWANDDGYHPFNATLLIHVDRTFDPSDTLYNFNFNVGDETYFDPGVPSPFSVNGQRDTDQAKSLIPGRTFTECTGGNFVSCGPDGYDLAFVFGADSETMFIHYDIFQSVFGANATTTVSLVTDDPGLTVSSFSGRFGLGPTPDAVPEPAAWASLVMGFGVMGAMLRRRPTRRSGSRRHPA